MRRLRALATTWSLMLAVATASAQTGDGYIGIYEDSAGTMPCTAVPPYSGKTLYVIAKLEGGTAGGISGAEFRIEVENSSGWLISYYAPAADITMGSALDLNPQDPDDGSGLNIVFAECKVPVNGILPMGTLSVINFSGGPTHLSVKRHSTPRNAGYPCPLFTLCDAPVFSKSCMTVSSAPQCSLGTSKTGLSQASSDRTDRAVFVAGLNVKDARQEERRRGGGIDLIVGEAQVGRRLNLVWNQVHRDIAGSDLPGKSVGLSTILSSPQWIPDADWSFDGCNMTGWTKVDNRLQNDGQIYWRIDGSFDQVGPFVVGNAAILGYQNDACCLQNAGYKNDWYQAIRMTYRGQAATLSFDFLLDVDKDFDFLLVETDSACASFGFTLDERPSYTRLHRTQEAYRSLVTTEGQVDDLSLKDYGSGTHCVYISFFSDGSVSHCDGQLATTVGAALVVDNIVLTDDDGVRAEDFTDGVLSFGWSFQNIHDSRPFGKWARATTPATDNDVCTENMTCAVYFTDHITPWPANDPSMAFGPGGFVIRNWLDDIIISPWVSLPEAVPGGEGTVLEFQEFPGNFFSRSSIIRSYGVRGKSGCVVSPWSDQSKATDTWEVLDDFGWVTRLRDITPQVDNVFWDLIQVRFRVSDYQLFGGAPVPAELHRPGPGPYLDRVRIGRSASPGPTIQEGPDGTNDGRWQAQDAFPTIPGTRAQPSLTRFGTTAFSMGYDLGAQNPSQLSANVIIGDSIVAFIKDHNGAGGIKRVGFFYCIAQGPHAGKKVPSIPGGFIDLMNGCYVEYEDVPANPPMTEGHVNVTFDDDYFLGGDVLRYFWYAIDQQDNISSNPPGITTDPVSGMTLQEAEALTGGLWEVNFLPTINWDTTLLAAIAADPIGKVDPLDPAHPEWRDEFPPNVGGDPGQQATCILYVNKVNVKRLSGDVNRTSFMYTLDKLGYRDAMGARRYDVYDVQGFGNTNNDLKSRATIGQAQGYSLIVHDAGSNTFVPLPDGRPTLTYPFVDITRKVDQAKWYRDWLEQGYIFAGGATLWLIGESLVQDIPSNPLVSGNMRVALAQPTNQSGGPTPEVRPVGGTVQFTNGSVTFDETYDLAGGCPLPANYDALTTTSGPNPQGVVTHRYAKPGGGTPTTGEGAIVMRSTGLADEGVGYNTIMMSHPWFDMYPKARTAGSPGYRLAQKILGAALPELCRPGERAVTDAAELLEDDTLPRVTRLYPSSPNPFNPATTIEFDLAQASAVELRVYNVSGRLVRTLVNEKLDRKRHAAVWTGLDDRDRQVASGIYFVRLVAGEVRQVQKVLLLK